MKRDRYVLRDAQGFAKVVVRTMPDDQPEIEPWMAENLRSRGWTIEKLVDPNPDAEEIEVHGYADWKRVAETLAEALRPLLADEYSVDNEEEAEAFLETAQQALDAFDVALMEVSMAALPTHPEAPEQEEEPDDS